MEKIAVIGSGIAGMTSAWFLKEHYDITLLEKANYAGGHTNTVLIRETGGKTVPIDTGFMVFNDYTYPNLIRFFDELDIPAIDTNMSFGVTNETTGFSFSSTGFKGFFANRLNTLNPKYWRLLFQLRRFFKAANDFINDTTSGELSLGEFMKQHTFDRLLGPNFIFPMASAIWSTHSQRIEEYPARSLFSFMRNHGLLGFGKQFTWKTISGGSRIYRDKIIGHLGQRVRLNCNILGIIETSNGVRIDFKEGPSETYDYVILATHADEALELLLNPNEIQIRLLSPFKYNRNTAVLHSDSSVMPRYRDAWASWNYHAKYNEAGGLQASTHYWMNQLQHLNSSENYFVSIDYKGEIDPLKIKWSAVYTHPCFNQDTLEAQRELPQLNKQGRIQFCGSYFRHGFHEDAHVSALNVVRNFKQLKGLPHEILPL